MVDIGGIKVARTGSRLLTAEDVAEVTEHIERLEAENVKLLELAYLVAEYTSEDRCVSCVAKRECNAGELDMCWIRKAILEKLRELGEGS